MKIIAPDYYHRFHCIASACPDSCCKEWAVAVDEASAEYYRTLPGDLGDALRTAMREEDGDTILALTPDRRCPMWRRDGLCRIHAELGEAALCHTCAQFPRLRHDYGSFAELGLELSCPEAAKLILACSRHAPVTTTEPGGEEPEYEQDIMDILLRTRAELLTFLDEATLPIGQTLAVMLLYGYSVQTELDGGEEAVLAPEETLREALSYAGTGSITDILAFYQDLEILTDTWRQRLAAPIGSEWTDSLRAIARYGIERYYLQAVSDYDLVSRVKLIILSCLVIKALGGNTLTTAQLYAKEIENDADNIDAILDGAYTAPALTDTNLLSLLLA